MTGRCPSCDGTGKRPLPRGLAEVAELLDATWRPTSVLRSQLRATGTAISPNAIANRLERLRGLGVVESRRPEQGDPRTVEWRLRSEP